MAASAPERRQRRGPAPIASFDHDVSDESSPETKQSFRLPEIIEDSSSTTADALAPPEQRARSHSTPAANTGALAAPPAPRIDISRASSSSHQDSRDSSPELALFAGASASGGGELGFREDGALDLRSSTEELAFLEPAPGERPAPPPAPPSVSRRHSRKDSQGSEAALLAVSGRTSRLSSVGSQCSAHSALSGFSRTSRMSIGRLSVASGASRSPSPHKMLLETSFCGPKPIETDPEICAAAVEERLLEMAKLSGETRPAAVVTPAATPTPVMPVVVAAPVDARDRREVRTEATVERSTPRSASRPTPAGAPTPAPPVTAVGTPAPVSTIASSPPASIDEDKKQKETKNKARVEERRARSRERRDPSEHRTKSRSKDIIRIRLKPSEEYEDDDDDDGEENEPPQTSAPKPVSLELSDGRPTRPTDFAGESSQKRVVRDSRTPSPAGVVVSRKSSFCSLFKSRETIASPESPSDALRRKKSINEGRSRSRSRDRSATPTSTTKIRGSVLSLFRTPRKSATSPSPSSRDGSPVVQPSRPITQSIPDKRRSAGERLKYYEDTKDGIIHIPLRTPPDEQKASGENERPASAPQPRVPLPAPHTDPAPAVKPASTVVPVSTASASTIRSSSPITTKAGPKPIQRTVLPDGSIIIPLHSPTEKKANVDLVDSISTPQRPETVEVGTRPGSSASEKITSPRATPGASTEVSATEPSPPEKIPTPEPAAPSSRRKERFVFSTHVGSRDQVFSTQFSITKTPSVTSEISGSFPSFPDAEESGASNATPSGDGERAVRGSSAASPQDPAKDSSESEASSDAAPARAGNDVEQRGLVVQESFEEELPYVPTTLPQERSLALPMVPVRERGGVHVAAVERPRPPRPAPQRVPPAPPRAAPQRLQSAPPSPAPAPPPNTDKIRIRLPRRPRTGSASAPPRPERARTRSGSDGMEIRPKTEWIDFEELPERRKQPKRIQTLPSAAAAAGGEGAAGGGAAGAGCGEGVVFSYVEPEECRCECHARADDETPLLQDELDPRLSASLEGSGCEASGAGGEEARLQLHLHIAAAAAPTPAAAQQHLQQESRASGARQ